MKKAAEFLQAPVREEVRIFAVTGEESFLREQVFEHIRSSLPEDVEVDVAEGAECKEPQALAALMDDLRTRGLFGGDRLVHLRDADKLPKELLKTLERFVVSGDAVHRLVVEGRALMGKGRKTAPKTGIVGAIAKGKGAVVSCDPLFDSPFQGRGPAWQSPLSRWVQGRARHYQKRLTLEDAYALHRLVGTGLRELDAELQKLALFVKERDDIGPDDIEEVVTKGRLAPVFDLAETVAHRDAKKALELTSLLFDRGYSDMSGRHVQDPAAIAMMLSTTMGSRIRKVGRVTEMLAAGEDFKDAAKAVRQSPFFLDRLRAQVESWRRAGSLPDAIHRLRDLDRELKTGAGAPRVLLERCIVELLDVRGTQGRAG